MPQTSVPLLQLVLPRIKKIFNRRVKTQLWTSQTELEVQIGPNHSDPIPFSKASKEKYRTIKSGEIFSPKSKGEHGEFPWDHRWFKVKIPTPKKGEKGNRYLRWCASGEFNIYVDGSPWCGLDCAHPEAPVPDKACTLYIECGVWQTGIWGQEGEWLRPADGFMFKSANLAIRNQEAWDVYHDLATLIEWTEYFFKRLDIKTSSGPGLKDPLKKIPVSLRKMVKRLGDACDAYEGSGMKALQLELKKIYKELPSNSDLMTASFVGHAHIDLVWLWPEKSTYKKGIHTFSTMLRLMDKYPDATFTMSQPPLYYHIAENEPKQAKEIQKRIKEGRWEFTGGFEVESDTQIPIGEGLARALMFGQKRIEAVRGKKSNTVWIPDVFGYSQCLPQIFKLGEIENFYTSKILWSTITEFPHNTFVWKSPDGSQILTHLALSGYNCMINVPECIEMAENYRQSDVHSEGLLAAGYGDGGGGLTEGHCERAKRLKSLTDVPKSNWNTVEGFFKGVKKVEDDLPRYRGELFLEYHRGVHTSQSDMKFYFRSCERAFQTHEAVRVMNGLGPIEKQPWLRYIFAQFHDAIPGSSINTVYKELNSELKEISEKTLVNASKDWGSSRKNHLCVFNPLAIPKLATIECGLPEKKGSVLVDEAGQIIPTQTTGKGKNKKVIAQVPLAGLESTELKWETLKKQEVLPLDSLRASPRSLKSDCVQASFSAAGDLEKLVIDGVEVLIESPAHFTLHYDSPSAFNAWDIDHQATWLKSKATKAMKLEVIECGPVRAILRGTSPVGDGSTLKVEYRIEANSPYLHVCANIDWQEEQKLLRYQIKTGYRGENARYGAPFGSTDRSQKEGLPKDEAMWEVPASRWASCIDGKGDGLAIITEAKYGFSVKDGEMGLSLLKAPVDPDPVADRGQHSIQFSLGLHSDDSTEEWLSTASAAESLFTPPVVVKGGKSQPAPFSLSSTGSVVPSWVLPSETGKGYVIRLHEVAGAQEELEIYFNHPVSSIKSVNLFEKEIRDGATIKKISDGVWSVKVDPYKIVSLLVRRK